MRELGSQGTRFEFECYNLSHVYNLAHFADRKIIEPPFFIQGVFGILGGIGAEPESLIAPVINLMLHLIWGAVFGASYGALEKSAASH